MCKLGAFIGGAVVGAAIALLFAPEKGEDLRDRIKEVLKKHGINPGDKDIDEVVNEITEELKSR